MMDTPPQRMGLALALEARREALGLKRQEDAVTRIMEIVHRLAEKDPVIAERKLSLTVAGWRNWVKPRQPHEADGVDNKWDPVIAEFLGVNIGELNYIRHGMSGPTPTLAKARKLRRVADEGSPADQLFASIQARDSALRQAIELIEQLEGLPATVNAVELIERLEQLEVELHEIEERLKGFEKLEVQVEGLVREVGRTSDLVARLTGTKAPARRARQTTS